MLIPYFVCAVLLGQATTPVHTNYPTPPAQVNQEVTPGRSTELFDPAEIADRLDTCRRYKPENAAIETELLRHQYGVSQLDSALLLMARTDLEVTTARCVAPILLSAFASSTRLADFGTDAQARVEMDRVAIYVGLLKAEAVHLGEIRDELGSERTGALFVVLDVILASLGHEKAENNPMLLADWIDGFLTAQKTARTKMEFKYLNLRRQSDTDDEPPTDKK